MNPANVDKIIFTFVWFGSVESSKKQINLVRYRQFYSGHTPEIQHTCLYSLQEKAKGNMTEIPF